MPTKTVKSGTWTELKTDASAVRYAVFVQEQKVPLSIEMDDQDGFCVHAVAYDGDQPIATGRLLPDANIGRMAVLADYRGQGIGALVLQQLMAAAQQRGDKAVFLSAQLHALGFYERHGFEPYGDVYEDANIPHRMMRYEC